MVWLAYAIWSATVVAVSGVCLTEDSKNSSYLWLGRDPVYFLRVWLMADTSEHTSQHRMVG